MSGFPSIPMTTEETIEFNKWLEGHDKQIIRNYLNKILGMRKTIIDEYGIIHSVVKSDDLEQLRIGWFEL